MHLPEKGGEDLSHTLKEVEDFGRDQPFDQVLFVERRCKKNDVFLQILGFVPRRLRQNMRFPETGGEGLANTLEEGEIFSRDQLFVQVLFVERRRKKNNLPSV